MRPRSISLREKKKSHMLQCANIRFFSVSVCKVDVGFKIMIKNSNTATCAAVIYTISTSYYLQHSLHLAIFRMISNYLKPFYDRFLCLFT